MSLRRGLTWLALATLLASGCDKTLTFDPPADEGNGGEPGSGGVSGSGAGGNAGSQGAQAGSSDEPWSRAGNPGTDPPATGGNDSYGEVDCQTFCFSLGQRCHKNTQKCVECVDDDECEPRGLLCDRASNRCVQCTGDFACPTGTSCDGWSAQCLERCDTDENRECSAASMMCDEDRCVSCREDADCADSGDRPYCLNGGARCVECASDDHCWSEKPNCDPVLFECVECADSRQCPDSMVCDPKSHLCYDSRLEVPFPT
jgi:hypothetical protein